MSSTKPVVVYGASGYTGRLICEYLREFNVPFIAAGRDKARIAEALDKVPGIDTVAHDWLIRCDDVYGQQMADQGLLLAPGVAQMYTTGEIAAQLCLETPGLDTLDIAVFWGGSPTIASTLTILVNAAMAKAYYLEQNNYAEWQPDAGLY